MLIGAIARVTRHRYSPVFYYLLKNWKSTRLWHWLEVSRDMADIVSVQCPERSSSKLGGEWGSARQGQIVVNSVMSDLLSSIILPKENQVAIVWCWCNRKTSHNQNYMCITFMWSLKKPEQLSRFQLFSKSLNVIF